jgi:hypothetical protein
LRNCQQDVQIAQLEPAADPVIPSHGCAVTRMLRICADIVLFSYIETEHVATEATDAVGGGCHGHNTSIFFCYRNSLCWFR